MFRDEAGEFQKSFRGEIPERCLGHFPGIFIAGPRNDWGLVQTQIGSLSELIVFSEV